MALGGSTIVCDTCGLREAIRAWVAYTGTDEHPAPPASIAARADAIARLGWKLRPKPDGHGWTATCPACLEQERAALADAWPTERRLTIIAHAARTARRDLTRALADAGDDIEAIRDAYGGAFDALSRITLVATEPASLLERSAAALGIEPAAALVAGDKPAHAGDAT